MFRKILYPCLFLLLALNVKAQLLSPDDFLPHKLGEQFTPHHMLVDYFQYVAENSDQVQLIEYGKTNEKRPLILAFISTKENLANLENIRKNNLRLAGLEPGTPDLANAVPIVWMSYSVHGNEAAGAESSMRTIYELLTRKDAQEWLKNTVIIMDPSVNPDGYSRYSHWVRGVGNKNPDPYTGAREHSEPWPGGRVNHYLFDLNRDWAWATQIETRRRLKQYQKWLPQIHVDFHEQYHNNPYYFAPAAAPYHVYITDWQTDFQYTIGRNNAKYFDREGWLYFTREVFDLLYPSYGDTYPIFNGSIGMTYEQGGHSRAGRAIQLENGDTLTLFDRIDHHTTTGLSTIEAASKNARQLVENFKAYFDQTQKNPPGEYKTFIIKAENNPAKIESLTDLLDLHQIHYGTAAESGKSVSGFDYQTGQTVNYKIGPNDLVISAYQPKGIFAQVLFDPKTEVVDSLTYDITGWAMPYARGLDAIATKARVKVSPRFEHKRTVAPPPTEMPYAWLAPWESLQSAKFLSAVLQAGVVVRYASEPFQLDGRNYERGTLVITRADNRKLDGLHKKVTDAALATQQEIVGAQTGFVTTGKDFGSETMVLIKRPKVLVLSGE
ncbi:MAG: zinc carboxypeptidase, partial [Bacteroidetes bacterium]